MRAVVQRCTKASVVVDGETISSIGRGLCVLVGISRDDTEKDMDFMARKLLNLRLFDDNEGKRWCHSVKDKEFEILLVSQFTLYGMLKGNKPDFHQSMGSKESEKFYSAFVAAMKQSYTEQHIKDGKFGAYMKVQIENEGPVTITLDSKENSKKELKNVVPLENEI